MKLLKNIIYYPFVVLSAIVYFPFMAIVFLLDPPKPTYKDPYE